MQKKNIVAGIIVGLALLGGSFYVGMQYGAKNAVKAQSAQGARSFGGGATGGRGGASQGGMQSSGQRGGAGGGFASGQIVAKDDTSVTIKSNDGSSKIVFFSGSTGVDKSVAGASSDLSVGQQVMANGKANPDGSITAQSIQIRPAQPAQQ